MRVLNDSKREKKHEVLSKMAYTPNYTADDTAPAVIDTLVKVVVAFASLASVVGLVIVYNFIKKKSKGLF